MLKPIFEEKFTKMVRLCGFIVKADAVDYYYDELMKLKYTEDAIRGGMRLMTDDPPAKLTLSKLKYFINETG